MKNGIIAVIFFIFGFVALIIIGASTENGALIISGPAGVYGDLTLHDDMIIESTDDIYLDGGGDTYISESAANIVTVLYGNGGYVEVVNANNSGQFAVGRTTGTDPSTLSITDGGADNEPGSLQIYNDAGVPLYWYPSTANEFRCGTANPADDDTDGYVIIDLDNGNIGAVDQMGFFDDVTLTDDLILADGAVVGIPANEVLTFAAAGTCNFTGCTVDIDGALTAATVASDATVVAATDVTATTGDVTAGDDVIDVYGNVRQAWPHVAAADPAEPFDCTLDVQGWMITVDDTDDGTGAVGCICLPVDDVINYEWQRMDDNTTVCPSLP